jgi:hypothetical protein
VVLTYAQFLAAIAIRLGFSLKVEMLREHARCDDVDGMLNQHAAAPDEQQVET